MKASPVTLVLDRTVAAKTYASTSPIYNEGDPSLEFLTLEYRERGRAELSINMRFVCRSLPTKGRGDAKQNKLVSPVLGQSRGNPSGWYPNGILWAPSPRACTSMGTLSPENVVSPWLFPDPPRYLVRTRIPTGGIINGEIQLSERDFKTLAGLLGAVMPSVVKEGVEMPVNLQILPLRRN
jgi:hypothetical protein